MLIESAAEHRDELLEAIDQRLEAGAEGSRWSMRQVAHGSWGTPAEPWLVVEHRLLPDIRHYVRFRDFGAHLEVVHITAIEPAWWKRVAASAIHRGAWWSWSVPSRGQADENLRSWLALVSHAVTGATKHLTQRLARGRVLGERVEDVLAWW
jgi:hypothetical protein